MFNTLEEQIEQSEASHLSTRQKAVRYLLLLAITVVIFGAVFMAVRLLG